MASLSPPATSEPLPAATLWLAAASALVLALIVAPRVFHNYDVVDCFLTWARASHGRQPWAIYLTHFATDDCDYPPVVPYLLTLVERARLALGAGETSGAAIVLLKLPNIVAWLAHVPLCAIGLRRPFGARAARVAALLVALSPPLFMNAAAWGQFDALLSLFVVAALVALLRGQAGRAGAALGLALATKLLAVVAIPVLALWAWRRRGARAILAGAAAALVVIALAAMPYVARGAARPVLSSYHGAVGYYPLRTVEAYNLWYVLDRVDIRMRGQPSGEARLDTFQFFAVFMLPTQMHQRYILPAAVLLALVAPLSPRARTLFAVLAVTATLNQGLDLGRAVLDHAVQVDPSRIGDPPAIRMAIRNVATGVALVHVGLLAWWTAVYRRELAALAALTPRGAAGFAAAPRPE